MANELYEKLAHIQWLLRRQQIRGWALNGPLADTTRGQGRILAVLKLRDGISTKDLSYLLGIRVSSLNEMLSKLERGGYVTREPSEQDKRVMLVKLTDKGRSEQQPDASGFNDIFACLSEDEQKVLGGYLDRIIDALHDKVGDDEEEMLEKIDALRGRIGDIGDFFEERGRDFAGRWGMGHGFRAGGHGRNGHGSHPGPHGHSDSEHDDGHDGGDGEDCE